jgi:hypothetical protein
MDDRFPVRDEGAHEKIGLIDGLDQKSHPPHPSNLQSFEKSKVNGFRKK